MTSIALTPAMTQGTATSTTRRVTKANRLFVFDLARFIAMVMMMQGHVLDALVSPAELNINVFPWNIWHFIRGLTAPVFLLISGAVFVFAAKRDESGRLTNATVWKRTRWAMTIMLVGYMLMFPANRIFDLYFVPAEIWKNFFQVNILQLTGAALILLTLVARLTRSHEQFGKVSLMIAAGIALLTPFIHNTDVRTFMPEAFAAYFSYTNGSLFPIFPFAAYSFAGAAIGAFLLKYKGEERLTVMKKHFAPLGAAVLAGGLLLAELVKITPFIPEHDFYRMDPGFTMIRSGIVLIVLAAISHLYAATRRFENIYAMYGQKALHIYVGHLILLFGTPWFGSIGRYHIKDMPLADGLLIALAVIAACLGGVYLLETAKKKISNGEKILRFSGALIMAYLLLV